MDQIYIGIPARMPRTAGARQSWEARRPELERRRGAWGQSRRGGGASAVERRGGAAIAGVERSGGRWREEDQRSPVVYGGAGAGSSGGRRAGAMEERGPERRGAGRPRAWRA